MPRRPASSCIAVARPTPDRLHTRRRRHSGAASGPAAGSSGPRACSSSPPSSRRPSTTPGTGILGFSNWRPTLYAYILWAIGLCVGQVDDPRRARASARSSSCRPRSSSWRWWSSRSSSACRSPSPTGTSPAPPAGSSTASTTSSRCGATRSTGTRSRNMVWYVPRHPRRVRHRLRPGAAAQRRHRGAQVLARRLPDAADALAGRGQLDGRQVDARAALRPGRPPRPLARLGQPSFFGIPGDRPG